LRARKVSPSANQVYAGPTSGPPSAPSFRALVPADVPASGTLDVIGSTRGSILERGASTWGIVPPGTSGLPWVSNGTGADPAYQVLTGGGIASGTVANSNLANMAAGTVKGSVAGGTPADLTGAQTESILQFTQAGTGANQRTLDSEVKLGCPHSKDWATGNGSTDDTTALGNWITQSLTVGCGFLDAGNYKISSVLTPISNSLTIRGAGANNSVITLSNTTQNAFSVTSNAPVHFYEFSITATGPQTAGACVIVSPSSGENGQSHFENLTFTNCWNAIDFEKASGFFVGYNTFLNNVAQAIIVRNTNNADSGDSVISSNNFQNTSAGSSIGIYQESSGGLKIVGNKINVVNIGIELNAATGISSSILPIIGNSIENCTAQCILLTTQTPAAGQWRAVQIVGNEIMTNAANAVGIKITAASTPTWLLDVEIVGNTLLINETGTGGVGIATDNVTNVNISNNAIENIGGGAGTGITISSATSIGSVRNNTFRSFTTGSDVTNASTTTLAEDVVNGHILLIGSFGTITSGGGTSPALGANTNYQQGEISTTGSTASTNIAVTFTDTFQNAPRCNVSSPTGPTPTWTTSTAVLALTYASATAAKFEWRCYGQ